MNKAFFILPVLVAMLFAGCNSRTGNVIQNNPQAEQLERNKQLLELMLANRTFVFNATDMMPRGSDAVRLNYDCDVQLKDSIMISYLPFFGRSYNLSPGQPMSGFDFTQEIEDYEFKEKRNGYQVKVDVKNGPDYLKYTFHVTETGSSTLTVASNQRQSIAFYGTIDARK